jgi:hypothetical protein
MSDTTVSIVIAILALIGSIVSAAVTGYVTLRMPRLKELRKARLTHYKYHNAILFSAYQLQSRFFHLVEKDFLARYDKKYPDYVVPHTIYLIG